MSNTTFNGNIIGTASFATTASTVPLSGLPSGLLSPVGSIQFFASGTNPGSDWLLCNGGLVSQSTYPTLYNRLGLVADELTPSKFVARTALSSNNGYYGPIFYLNNRFVVLGNNSQFTQYATSSNGTTWTTTQTGLGGTQFVLTWGMTFGSGSYVAAADNYNTPGNITVRTSTDLISWTDSATLSGTRVGSLQFANNRFLLFVYIQGTGGVLYTSSNATTWSNPITVTINTEGIDLYASGSGRIVVGSSWKRSGPPGLSQGYFYSTTNLTTWTVDYNQIFASELLYVNNQFVALNGNTDERGGKISFSPSGTANTWTSYAVTQQQFIGYPRGLMSLAYTPAGYISVMVGDTSFQTSPYVTENGIYISQTGYSWDFSRAYAPNKAGSTTTATAGYMLYEPNNKILLIHANTAGLTSVSMFGYNTGSEFRLPLGKSNNFQLNGNWYIKAT